MLYFDFQSIFHARNITNPYSLLVQNGFSQRMAYNIAHRKLKTLRLESLYKVCMLCNCTPNDVIRYKPDERVPLNDLHSLNKIKGDVLSTKAKNFLQQLSMEDLNALANMVVSKS